jgi:hypothetical protein
VFYRDKSTKNNNNTPDYNNNYDLIDKNGYNNSINNNDNNNNNSNNDNNNNNNNNNGSSSADNENVRTFKSPHFKLRGNYWYILFLRTVMVTFVVSISLSFDIYYIVGDSLFMYYLMESLSTAVENEEEGGCVYDINKIGNDDVGSSNNTLSVGVSKEKSTPKKPTRSHEFYSWVSLRQYYEGTRRKGKRIIVDDLHNDAYFNHGYGYSMLNEGNGIDIEYKLLTSRGQINVNNNNC